MEVIRLVEEELMDLIMNKALEEDMLEILSEQIISRDIDPYSAKDNILKLIKSRRYVNGKEGRPYCIAVKDLGKH